MLLSNGTRICAACSGVGSRLDSGQMSRTFLARLHFDGTAFVGWQRQPAGRSVQGEFERTLERLFTHPAVAHAAGRTDAGVHATGLAVSFPSPRHLDPRRAPPRAQRAPAEGLLGRVGPRHAGTASMRGGAPSPAGIATTSGPTTARLRLFAAPTNGPWHASSTSSALRSAATLLLGEHDFQAFAIKGEPKPHYRSRLDQSPGWLARAAAASATTSKPTDSSTTWCGCWWARWWTSACAGVLSPTSSSCWSAATTGRPARPPLHRGSTSSGATYPESVFAEESEEAHAGADRV